MKKIFLVFLIFSGILGSGFAIWYVTKPKADTDTTAGDTNPGPTKKPLSVNVALVVMEPVPILLESVGTVEPEQSVAIRPEVTGTLQGVFFREGDLVKAGQLLFQIDPKAFQAEVNKARAIVARDQALLAEAQAQERRLAPLVQQEYITRQEYDQAVAQKKSAAATAQVNRAQLQSVQIQYERTRIRAPISGRAGNLNIKPGNLVTATTQDPLVVINRIQPVLVSFSIPQQQLETVRHHQQTGVMQVEIRREKDSVAIAQGTLTFIDNSVDPITGTIKLKAQIPNETEALWPGELVTLRLVLGIQTDALTVPETAVQPGQQGSFVYVIDQGKAQVQPVNIARQIGPKIVIANGLTAGQQVIVNVPHSLKPGSPVQAMAPKEASTSTPGQNSPVVKDKPQPKLSTSLSSAPVVNPP